MQDDGTDESGRLRDAITGGSEIVGAVAGGAIGLSGAPETVLIGAAAGVAISRALAAIGQQVLENVRSRRSSERIGATLAIAAADADALIAEGRRIRNDDFFRPSSTGRSTADELLEGILLHAADTYEERKVRHLAAIFPLTATDAGPPAADALWMSETIHRLSWRQLVALATFAPREGLYVDPDDEMRSPGPYVSPALQEEIQALGDQGLLGVTGTGPRIVRSGTTHHSSSRIWGAPIEGWALTPSGQALAHLARLDDVPAAETAALRATLGLDCE